MSDYEKSRPLVFFWIAFYSDNTCLPQFDFKTGRKNDFKEIDQTKLEKFGLFSFNVDLATKANQIQAGICEVKNNLPFFMMKLEKDQRLISVRRNAIHNFSFLRCKKCGYKWQWMITKTVQRAEFGMMIHPDHFVQRYLGKEHAIPKCPKCGTCALPILCLDCGFLINELSRPENKSIHYWKCPRCNKEYTKDIEEDEGCIRQAIYLLGWQKTEGGVNVKHIMFINEDGSFEINEDFNYK